MPSEPNAAQKDPQKWILKEKYADMAMTLYCFLPEMEAANMSETNDQKSVVAVQIIGGVQPPVLAPELELAPPAENLRLLPVKRTPGTYGDPAEPAAG
jgi:hypothetical protein